tara:strand:+ start:2231 stop:2452 length:222 start_codon:yes stop_codon:yes gene_type:complete
MKNYKIEGHGDLARDPETNSIVNINSSDYDQHIARKKLKEKRNQKTQNIEEDLIKLKGEIQEIKSLLKEILNK